MDNLFQNRWFVLFISLVFSISLYFFVTTETDKSNDAGRLPGFSTEVQTLEEVPLQVKMDADQYVVSGVPDFVRVSLEGKTSALTRLIGNNNYNFYIDLTNLSEGEHVVDVKYDNVPDDLTVYIEPKNVEVVIERRASAEFTVEVDFVNRDQLPVDYELGTPELSTDKVTIVSSESVIEKIAMVKVYIDVADLRESIRNREVPISVSDIQGNALNVRVDPGVVTVSVPVDRPSRKVPLEVVTEGELAEGLSLVEVEAPEDVDVYGRTNVLEALEGVATEAIDLTAITDTTELDVALQLPDNIRMNAETIKVKLVVEKESKFNIPLTIEGAGNREVNIVQSGEDKLDVLVRGTVERLKNLKENQLTATIDVSELDVGTHTVPIVIKGPSNVAVEPARETVRIQIVE